MWSQLSHEHAISKSHCPNRMIFYPLEAFPCIFIFVQRDSSSVLMLTCHGSGFDGSGQISLFKCFYSFLSLSVI